MSRPILSGELRAALSGSVIDSFIETRPPADREILKDATWMLSNTRHGKTTIISKLHKQYNMPKSHCEKIILDAYGKNVFINRNRKINTSFVEELKVRR